MVVHKIMYDIHMYIYIDRAHFSLGVHYLEGREVS